MTQATVVTILQKEIAALSARDQITVMYHLQFLRDWLHTCGDLGALAFALVGAEGAAMEEAKEEQV